MKTKLTNRELFQALVDGETVIDEDGDAYRLDGEELMFHGRGQAYAEPNRGAFDLRMKFYPQPARRQ